MLSVRPLSVRGPGALRRSLRLQSAAAGLGQKAVLDVQSLEDFHRLTVRPVSKDQGFVERRRFSRSQPLPPRASRMRPSVDWPSVWPTQKSFKYSAVPLPLRMGYQKRPDKHPPPPAYANLELVKVPNFLHLTPKAIQRQCQALKEFCTAYPEELKDPAVLDRHFPLSLTTSDWVHSGTSLREPRARAVTLSLKLSALQLSERSKDKLLRLARGRYDYETDVLSLAVDRCPRRHQNVAYAEYLLSVLFFECQTAEPWESEKLLADDARFVWHDGLSQRSLRDTLRRLAQRAKEQRDQGHHLTPFQAKLADDQDFMDSEEVNDYVSAWDTLRNQPESLQSLSALDACVRTLLGVATLGPSVKGNKPNAASSAPAQGAQRTVDTFQVAEPREAEAEPEAPRRKPRRTRIATKADIGDIL